jgi:hypothetical protein
MTMMHAAHPDPERLAALAGDDADARADHGLTEHVASCASCGRQVREMGAMRIALAELPDLAPSRPLQHVPPVAAPAPSGWRTAFRRAFAPVAAAGMVLLLVGGIGVTGALGPADAQRLFNFMPAAAPAPQEGQPEITTDDGAAPPTVLESPAGLETEGGGGVGVMGPTPAGPEAGGEDDQGGEEEPTTRGEDLDAESTGGTGWLVLSMVGLGLLVLAFFLRAAAPKRVTP